ncbi:MAG: DUF3267 domain-containing protein [Clostridia bacterium]|nr:DUF3267 domain-containing protein [Clostridia bacterium]
MQPMHAMRTLPEGATLLRHIDMQKDKHTMRLIAAIALVLAVVMLVPAMLVVPISTLFDMSEGMGAYALRFVTLIAGYIAYMVLHEGTHAAVMKLEGGGKVRFGFTGMYAYAGSEEDYFTRPGYFLIAMAPVVVWGILFGTANFLVPRTWFYVIYFLQIGNVSGAAGDLYMSFLMLKYREDLLVRDTGVEMHIYRLHDIL